MKFSIITPSFRNSVWLKLCIPSIADQSGVTLEHIVQDSCSDDGTGNWLPNDTRVKAFIEKDSGMYDAVNRGFRRAQGEILAYLNCDEQYLPGALKKVGDFFDAHPDVETVFSDTIVTDAAGNYICHRASLVPGKASVWERFPLTCAIFLRRSVVYDRGIEFDTKWRDLGDFWWMREFVERGVRMAVLPELTSVFADTGDNMNLKPNAWRERGEKERMTPRWIKLLKPYFVVQSRLRLALRTAAHRPPFDYSLYTMASPTRRVVFHAAHPTTFWKGRMHLKPVTAAP
ncbi:MAG TPA: glycosyltransferase [Verrucomicrobiae bacterium]|jgi:glycosyltransferase involved in cell wall biosynthesis